MEDKSKTRHWSEDEETWRPYQFQQIFSMHREYANEGDEFLDDALRTIDQDVEQMDGTLEVWRMRSARAARISK